MWPWVKQDARQLADWACRNIRKFDRERLGNIVISGAALQDERRHSASQPRHSEIRIRVWVLK